MLNNTTLSYNCFYKTSLAFIILALFINLGCGKRKPPLPPLEKITQRVEISGIQQGNIISLTWNIPARNVSESSSLYINRADIYRLTEPATAPPIVSEEEFASRSTLISSVEITDEDFRRKQLIYNDTLEFAGQNVRLRYAIRFVNASGQKAAFSNFLLIEPTAKVAASPTSLSAKVSDELITFQWNAPTANVDGSKPANIIGYNIYRITDENIAKRILNNAPITATNYGDAFFEFGKDYRYFVRTISLGDNGEPVESINSNTVEVKPRDIFAPSPPSAITVAAAANNLSIFFAVNPETDVAGYRIYRSTNRNQNLSEWNLLTKDLLITNTFQDKNVVSGETYFYYLTAVDKNGNVSEASAIVFDTAP